jgi:membrane-associated phospholipid phosphatase
MAAVALWGLLPVVVALYTRRRSIWWASVVVSATLIAGISASRVYLGVHWFSDVVGGLVVGTFFLLGVDTVLIRAHRRYPCRMLAEQAERDRAARAEAAAVERRARVPVGSAV